MTDRLYYDDAYLTEFDGTVLACEKRERDWVVRLDRSAFYPTSGGQPFDTGRLGGAAVLDVFVDEAGEVWHAVDAPMEAGQAVHGSIDWPRRFDHMQQHAADHMIASALWRHMGGVTIGLHISAEVSTIDVAMPEGVTRISAEDIRAIEDDVNARVQRDVPVRCWFPEPGELAALPLRKPPTVSEHVRVVAIGEDEMVACGGTHPSTAGQLGLVKILGVTPARGKMRVSFVAGKRAYEDYRKTFDSAHGTAALLSTGVEQLESHVAAMQEELKAAHAELGRLRREEALRGLMVAVESAPRLSGGAAVVARMLEGDANLLKDAASKLIKAPCIVALLGAKAEDRAVFVFARSADVDVNMGKLLAAAAKPLGGKGGGRPDFAQGGGDPAILDAALQLLMENKS
ncbi:MAG: DHHA1 domain-containing protein [Clostridia bacterium]|nr:DHHA1 domain-containing protein [Clostridia bacterium]